MRDNGNPVMTASTMASIQVIYIRPRITFVAPNATADLSEGMYWLPGSPNVGFVISDVGGLTWTPLNRAGLTFSLDSAEDTGTPEPDRVFVINPNTGVLSIANNTYYASNSSNVAANNGSAVASTIVGFGPPRFNYNFKNVFTAVVRATQLQPDGGATIRSATIKAYLPHSNRPPFWTRGVPPFFARASEFAQIGTPMSAFASDPDMPLNIGENLTYSIVSGNSGSTFDIDAASGQIFVRDDSTTAFRAPPAGPGFFNLTIRVMDRGLSNGPPAICCSPRWANTWVYINVTDNNRRPNVTYARLSVPEFSFPAFGFQGYLPASGSRNTTIVGDVFATDFDTMQTLTYSLSPRGRNANRPFPFNITTLAGGPTSQNKGQIFVIDDGPIDYNDRFPTYEATVSACDNHPTMPLCGNGNIDIDVTLVNRPPYFDATNRVPSARVAFLRIDENATMGMNVTSAVTVVRATSKDPARRAGLRYAWVNPGLAYNSTFAVDPITAMITVATPDPSQLDFNVIPVFNMTLQVTDSSLGLTDTALISIALNDINNPARFQGLWAADNSTKVPVLSVDERASSGSIIGYARFTDQDRSPSMGRVYYTFDPPQPQFAIHPDSGVVTRSDTGVLDYWDQTSYIVTISVTDFSDRPIVVRQDITINLIQVRPLPDCTNFAPFVAPACAFSAPCFRYHAVSRYLGRLHRSYIITAEQHGERDWILRPHRYTRSCRRQLVWLRLCQQPRRPRRAVFDARRHRKCATARVPARCGLRPHCPPHWLRLHCLCDIWPHWRRVHCHQLPDRGPQHADELPGRSGCRKHAPLARHRDCAIRQVVDVRFVGSCHWLLPAHAGLCVP